MIARLFIFFLGMVFLVSSAAQRLEIKPNGEGLELAGRPAWGDVAGLKGIIAVEASRDLESWEALPELALESLDPGGVVKWILSANGEFRFFRLATTTAFQDASTTSEEVLGYGAAFRKALAALGQIPPEKLLELYPAPQDYLLGLTWDPATAQFWDLFNTDPAVNNQGITPSHTAWRYYDFRLNPQEFAMLQTNGFVVSERLGAWSFAEVFYRIFIDDLPVFVSADAILQAWHRSYDSLLQEVEEVVLGPDLKLILAASSAQLPALLAIDPDTFLTPAILDADYFLAVAMSLLSGTNAPSQFGQAAKVEQTLALIQAQAVVDLELFGNCRKMDFSQFKPRGHYEDSLGLKRYFQAMMWLGRTDFRIAEAVSEPDCPVNDPLRELGGAIVLQEALQKSGAFPLWEQFDRVLQVFVGWPDSMNFPQLTDLLHVAGIDSIQDIPSPAELEALQEKLLTGTLGMQEVRGDLYLAPLDDTPRKLPRSFTFMGQRFTPDSWCLSQFVFDAILWRSDPSLPASKVMRRIPSGLDVAFSVFGNNAVTPEIISRIHNSNGEPWRDGLSYQHNLAAARTVMEQQTAESWHSNIYLSWLDAIRSLSPPTTAPLYPDFMRTKAWAERNIYRQLASWTQLRHDTILYVKQSYTSGVICSYPAGFVEPVTNFWHTLEATALRTRDLLASLELTENPAQPWRSSLQTNQIRFLNYFAEKVAMLRQLSEKELAQQPFTPQEQFFIENLIENMFEYGGIRQFSGWYPQMFYRAVSQDYGYFHTLYGSDRWDALVVDVHSDPPEPIVGDPGCILHQGVGNVFLLMTAVNNGPDRMIFAGPVFSYYEFKTPWPQRKTDREWKKEIIEDKLPPHPDWSASFLVPGELVIPEVPYE